MKIQVVSLIAAGLLGVVLSGCEQPGETGGHGVIARVGDATISEAELDHATARLGRLAPAESRKAQSRVLEALIDQHLISNAAKEAKLDLAPDVMLALQQAQRQVLVEAYLDRLFKKLPKLSDTEVNDYYVRHPELFSARRIYRIQELDLEMAATRLPEVEAQLKQSNDLADFAEWLRVQGIEAKAGQVVKLPEQIPPLLLAQLRNMKDGEVTVVATEPKRVSVLQLQGSQPVPMTFEQARSAIEQVLQNERRQKLTQAEIKRLRGSGRIEYASGYIPAVAEGTTP